MNPVAAFATISTLVFCVIFVFGGGLLIWKGLFGRQDRHDEETFPEVEGFGPKSRDVLMLVLGLFFVVVGFACAIWPEEMAKYI